MMTMSWVPVYDDVTRNKKTRDAAAALKVSRHQLVGHLVAFWTWAVDKEPGGGPLYAEDVALNAEWEGKASRFVDVLTEHGFLELLDDGRYQIHDWEDGGGRINRMRAGSRNRMRRMRGSDAPVTRNGTRNEAATERVTSRTQIRSEEIRDPERAHARVSEGDSDGPIDWEALDRRARELGTDRFVHQRSGS